MNKKGSTLVMTIFLVMLLSTLAFGLLLIAVSDKKQVTQQDDQMQTYYLARSVADTIAEYLILNPSVIKDINSEHTTDVKLKIGGNATIFGGPDASYDVSVEIIDYFDDEDDDPDNNPIKSFKILATANVKNRSKTVELMLSKGRMKNAIFSNLDLDISGFEIIGGDVGSNGYVTGEAKELRIPPYYDYDKMEEYPPTYGIPIVSEVTKNIFENKEFTFDEDSEIVGTTVDLNINDGEYESIASLVSPNIEGATVIAYEDARFIGEDLIFDTTEGDIILVVDYYESKSNVIILGDNKVIICVRIDANVQTPTKVGVNDEFINRNPDKLLFLLGAGSTMNIQTPTELNCRIIGPESYVSFKSGILNGSIVANEFVGGSQAEIHYADSVYDYLGKGFHREEWK